MRRIDMIIAGGRWRSEWARSVIRGVAMACLACGFAAPFLPARQASEPPDWTFWRGLLGEWTGGGEGDPGQGVGSFAFAFDLQGRILVRRNRTDFPATKNRPPFFHEDLMIVYPGPGNLSRAVYFDNEGHVIHYAVTVFPAERKVTLISDPDPLAPRFRLTYRLKGSDAVTVRFDIAPPGKPDDFSFYLQGTARRMKGK
jgi:hypothetical protein